MNRQKITVMFILPFVLSGCGLFTQDTYKTHSEMYAVHQEYEYNRISNQAEAIVSVSNASEFATPVEAALYKVIAVQAIRDIEKDKFNRQAPLTGYDVLNSVAGGIPMMVLGLTSYGISKKAMQYGGNSYQISADELDMESSFNRNDVSTIGSDNVVDVNLPITNESSTGSLDEVD